VKALFSRTFSSSIQLRFLGVMTIVLVISTAVLSSVIAVNEASMLEHALMKKGESLATYISKFSQDAILTQDSLQLDAIVNEANKDEDIVYTVIYDREGRLLTSQYASLNVWSPLSKKLLPKLPKDNDLTDIIEALKKESAIRELSVPITVDVHAIGSVSIGMSTYSVRREVFKTVFFVLAVNAIAAIVLGTVLFLFSRKTILTPIARLADAASRLAHGDLGIQVAGETTGEVKMLIDSFNRMAEDLRSTTVSKDYLDNIIGSMREALMVLNPDGSIVRLNMATRFLLGYDEAELVGRALGQVLDEPGAPNATLGSILRDGSVSSVEKICLAKDGKKIPVLFSASVMQDADGEVQGIVCVAQNIADRKRDEERLRVFSEELQKINEELKSFAYIVSHDLRAPLVNIRGFADELDRSVNAITACFDKHLPMLDEADKARIIPVLNKDIPEALEFIGSSVSRMDNLINAILKLSRVGRRDLKPEHLSTQMLVQDVVNSFAHQIESAGARVNAHALPEVVADKTALEQIFGNLLDNAVKYLEPGRRGVIDVTADQRDGETVFHVRDNGRGMAKEDIPKAFEIFRRVGRQDVPGEGMGLAYVKTLVRSLGGRIWCETEPGRGTTFSFTLPLPEKPAPVRHDGPRV